MKTCSSRLRCVLEHENEKQNAVWDENLIDLQDASECLHVSTLFLPRLLLSEPCEITSEAEFLPWVHVYTEFSHPASGRAWQHSRVRRPFKRPIFAYLL